jgi:pyridoxamine 5'-phosphate oxidase
MFMNSSFSTPVTGLEPIWSDDAAREHTNSLWALAERGVADRHSVWHTPTFATQHDTGRPDLRTVVLRAASRSEWTMRVHTDRRSAKANQLAVSPSVAVHVYDPRQKLQVRIFGIASLHRDDDIAEAAWAATKPMSRVGYAQEQRPGDKLKTEHGPPLNVGQHDDQARLNFTAVVIRVLSIDWLHLSASGHRRAIFQRNSESLITGSWLAP